MNSDYVLRLIKGEPVMEKIIEFCEKENISGASITGIGALEKAEIGHYSLKEKKYVTENFEEDLEVLALNGNISLKEKKPFVHAHVTLGKKDFTVIGGHLVSAKVGATLELFIHNLGSFERKKEEETELFLLDLK